VIGISIARVKKGAGMSNGMGKGSEGGGGVCDREFRPRPRGNGLGGSRREGGGWRGSRGGAGCGWKKEEVEWRANRHHKAVQTKANSDRVKAWTHSSKPTRRSGPAKIRKKLSPDVT